MQKAGTGIPPFASLHIFNILPILHFTFALYDSYCEENKHTTKRIKANGGFVR